MVGYVRVAEDDSSNTAESVDANEGFRHDCTEGVSTEECEISVESGVAYGYDVDYGVGGKGMRESKLFWLGVFSF